MSRYSLDEIERQVTEAMVASEGQLVRLSRKPASVEDGAGGFLESDGEYVTLPARRRVVASAALNVRNGNTREFFQDVSGERYEIKYVLIGVVGDDIRQGDRFTHRGEDMVVADVAPDKTYEVRAQVIGWSDGM